MTDRAVGDLVEALVANPQARYVVVVPDLPRQRVVMYQLLDVIRQHTTLKVAWSKEWEFGIEGAGHKDPSVLVLIPNSDVASGAKFNRVILDEVVNDPKEFWLQACVMSRLVKGGEVRG